MLSLFPELFAYRELSPFILRITLGVIILIRGYEKYKIEDKDPKTWAITIIEIVSGVLLVAGFLTQAAAVVAVVDQLRLMWGQKSELGFLIIIVAISLLFLGPGAFAIDARY